MFAVIILGLLYALIAFSIVLNLRDWRWRADIETADGLRKFRRIGYERLQLERRRQRQGRSVRKKGYLTDDDYITVALDAPFAEARTSGSGILFGADNGCFEQLRVLGWKDGRSHTVYTIYANEATCRRLKALVDELNRELQVSARS